MPGYGNLVDLALAQVDRDPLSGPVVDLEEVLHILRQVPTIAVSGRVANCISHTLWFTWAWEWVTTRGKARPMRLLTVSRKDTSEQVEN